MNKLVINKLIAVIALLLFVAVGCYAFYRNGYDKGYDKGYANGYDVGYKAGYEERNKLVEKEIADAVQAHSKTETKIIYEKIPYNGNDVQIKTEPPVVTVDINGKTQKIQQHTETADLAVKTEGKLSIRIPERRWSAGLGTDGHKVAYMLKAPIKGAVGVWIAGSGKDKVMGGVSVSF